MRMSLSLLFLMEAIVVSAVPNHWRKGPRPWKKLGHVELKSAQSVEAAIDSDPGCDEADIACRPFTTVFGVTVPISPATPVSMDHIQTTIVLEPTTVIFVDPVSTSSVENTSQVVEKTTSVSSVMKSSTSLSALPISSAETEPTESPQTTTQPPGSSFTDHSASVTLYSSSSEISSGQASTTAFQASQSSTPISKSSPKALNDTTSSKDTNSIDSSSTSLSIDAKVGICSAGVMFFLFVVVTSIYLLKRHRRRQHISQVRQCGRHSEEEPIAAQACPHGIGDTGTALLTRYFSRPSREKPRRSKDQSMSTITHPSPYPHVHLNIAADSTAMIGTWMPTGEMRRYDCVVLSQEAQEFHEHTQHVQEMDERDDGTRSSFEIDSESIIEGYSVLPEGASSLKAGGRASTICTLGAKSEVGSAIVGGTW